MFYKKLLHGVFSTILLSSVLVLGLGNAQSINTLAAGVEVSISPSTQQVSTLSGISLGLTTTIDIPVNGIIEVTYPTSGYDGTPTISIAGETISTAVITTSGSDTVVTVTALADILAGAKTISVTGLTTTAVPGNNVFSIYTSAGDFGAAFQYVGEANVTTVRAIVPISLSFAIRSADDTSNTNTCDMGRLSVSTIGSCSYRLKVLTNAAAGYTISKSTNGGFTNGLNTFPNAAIGTNGTGGTAQSTGVELYGVKVNPGSVTTVGGVTTLANDYNAGLVNNVNYSSTTIATLIASNKPNNPSATDLVNTSLITHEAGINASTAGGVYRQKVTYTVTPSFSIVR
jgi:hypothetical protein